jgi:two-component system sensor histidine kinase QseC
MSRWHRRRWLWQYLWGWTLLVALLTWTGLGFTAYLTGLHEAREITDGHLKSMADLLMRVKELGNQTQPFETLSEEGIHRRPDRYGSETHVVAWENQRVTWDTHGMVNRLPDSLVDGHHTLVLATDNRVQTWRMFVKTEVSPLGTTRRVTVLTDTARHQELALDMAEHIIRPALIVFPLTALLLVLAIRRGLRPLNQLSADMTQLDVRAGKRLEGKQDFVELESTVQAIHHLVDQLQHQWARERQFNADVAHELRTPLTSAVLQAHIAQTAQSAQDRMQALRQVEADTLRAAHILSQLLELARAEQSPHHTREDVDLCSLALEISTQHVALADELGQSLSLLVPDNPVLIPGNQALLGLALRNLVDNALRHNPCGTQVEIEVTKDKSQGCRLAVSDDGHFDANGSQHSGLGVGLTLVRRIAESQGAVFGQEIARAPFKTRLSLHWATQSTN